MAHRLSAGARRQAERVKHGHVRRNSKGRFVKTGGRSQSHGRKHRRGRR